MPRPTSQNRCRLLLLTTKIQKIETAPNLAKFGTLAPDLLDLVRHSVQDKALQQQGINELLAVGVSDFSGSTQSRIQNIKTANARYQNLIVPPGEVFSFNQHLGPVTYANGFVDSKVIKNGKSVKGLGGGVCQTSSTVYRAALAAGLPVVERYNHSFAVGYYGPIQGLDATIWRGQKDLRFTNNTPASILIKPVIAGNRLMVFVYGTPDRRTKVWNTAERGNQWTSMSAQWLRAIEQNGIEVAYEEIDSYYKKPKY